MRVAVLSDIHSNAAALDAVLDAIGSIDQLWVLGDIVGYGPDPDAVVDRLRERDARAVAGNHDAAVVGRLDRDVFNSMARAAVEWTAASASAATLAWLEALSDRRVEGEFTLVHGSPREPMWEYLFSVPAARRSFAAYETPHCLVGHTHHPLIFRHDDGHIEVVSPRHGSRIVLDGRRCILNPGSVGQPRDGDPRACAMTIDTGSGTVEWLRVTYDFERTQEKIRALPLPGALADRLELGV